MLAGAQKNRLASVFTGRELNFFAEVFLASFAHRQFRGRPVVKSDIRCGSRRKNAAICGIVHRKHTCSNI